MYILNFFWGKKNLFPEGVGWNNQVLYIILFGVYMVSVFSKASLRSSEQVKTSFLALRRMAARFLKHSYIKQGEHEVSKLEGSRLRDCKCTVGCTEV